MNTKFWEKRLLTIHPERTTKIKKRGLIHICQFSVTQEVHSDTEIIGVNLKSEIQHRQLWLHYHIGEPYARYLSLLSNGKGCLIMVSSGSRPALWLCLAISTLVLPILSPVWLGIIWTLNIVICPVLIRCFLAVTWRRRRTTIVTIFSIIAGTWRTGAIFIGVFILRGICSVYSRSTYRRSTTNNVWSSGINSPVGSCTIGRWASTSCGSLSLEIWRGYPPRGGSQYMLNLFSSSTQIEKE